MSRQLKFRAWDKKLKKWLMGYQGCGGFSMFGEMMLFQQWAEVLEEYGCCLDGSKSLHDIELQQFTGLLDKNGKEIYEGDILLTDLSCPYAVVVFKCGAFMYQCHDDGKDYFDFMQPSDSNATQELWMEVIGNIFENPELLEVRP